MALFELTSVVALGWTIGPDLLWKQWALLTHKSSLVPRYALRLGNGKLDSGHDRASIRPSRPRRRHRVDAAILPNHCKRPVCASAVCVASLRCSRPLRAISRHLERCGERRLPPGQVFNPIIIMSQSHLEIILLARASNPPTPPIRSCLDARLPPEFPTILLVAVASAICAYPLRSPCRRNGPLTIKEPCKYATILSHSREQSASGGGSCAYRPAPRDFMGQLRVEGGILNDYQDMDT